MKIVTIIGARPQFIKASTLSKLIKKQKKIKEIIIHTGQHYDYEMSKLFFNQLNIPKPKYNLNIKSNYHGEMTGKMVLEIEKVLLKEIKMVKNAGYQSIRLEDIDLPKGLIIYQLQTDFGTQTKKMLRIE